MVSFRLDPKLAELMDGRCKDLGQTRAEFLRWLITTEVGSPGTESDSTDVQLAIADRIDGLEQLIESYEVWVIRQIGSQVLPVVDRIAVIEAALKKRGVL